MRVLLDRIQHNETRMNNLCQRLSNLTQLSKESQDEQPFSDEELKFLKKFVVNAVRKTRHQNVIFLIHNVTRLPLHVGLGFPRLVVPYLTL